MFDGASVGFIEGDAVIRALGRTDGVADGAVVGFAEGVIDEAFFSAKEGSFVG